MALMLKKKHSKIDEPNAIKVILLLLNILTDTLYDSCSIAQNN